MNDRGSLKEQLIASLEQRLGRLMAESVFQRDIWPVLDAAMTAGELLVSRNTQPTVSVPEAVQTWLEGVLKVVAEVRAVEATVSKRELLTLLYKLEMNGAKALADIKGTLTPEMAERNPEIWFDEAASLTREQIDALHPTNDFKKYLNQPIHRENGCTDCDGKPGSCHMNCGPRIDVAKK